MTLHDGGLWILCGDSGYQMSRDIFLIRFRVDDKEQDNLFVRT